MEPTDTASPSTKTTRITTRAAIVDGPSPTCTHGRARRLSFLRSAISRNSQPFAFALSSMIHLPPLVLRSLPLSPAASRAHARSPCNTSTHIAYTQRHRHPTPPPPDTAAAQYCRRPIPPLPHTAAARHCRRCPTPPPTPPPDTVATPGHTCWTCQIRRRGSTDSALPPSSGNHTACHLHTVQVPPCFLPRPILTPSSLLSPRPPSSPLPSSSSVLIPHCHPLPSSLVTPLTVALRIRSD